MRIYSSSYRYVVAKKFKEVKVEWKSNSKDKKAEIALKKWNLDPELIVTLETFPMENSNLQGLSGDSENCSICPKLSRP